MKKTIVSAGILAISTMIYGASDNFYVGVGYDGVSLKKDFTEVYTAQISYGGFSQVSGLKGRILYKFKNNNRYNLYGFGGLMYATQNINKRINGGYGTSVKADADITTKGFEFGAGVEYDLQKNMHYDMPVFVSIEVGYRASSTDVAGKSTVSGPYSQNYTASSSASSDYSGPFGGMWIHYKF